MISTFL